MEFRPAISKHFHQLVQISRKDIFGELDIKYAPVNLPNDAATMFGGYIGANYRPGFGLLLLAINPGGGGDAYTKRIPEDEIFYPLLMEFKSARGAEILPAFENINKSFASIVQRWNLWRILKPTLDAANKSIDEVAYMNVVPYRTRGDAMPPVTARKEAWRSIIEPTIEMLKPNAVVTLGKKAGSVVDKLYNGEHHLYCVPRTIGDSRVSEDALAVHRAMRKDLA